MPDDGVVLLHGIFRTYRSMRKLARFLEQNGFAVLNIDYPSTKFSIEFLAERINPRISAFAQSIPGKVHFVGYSMGGLLIRAYLQRFHPQNLGRVVMLGTPNHGSEVADFLCKMPIYCWLYGPAGQQLITNQRDVAIHLGEVHYELGIIAGNRPIDPIWMYALSRLAFSHKAPLNTEFFKQFIIPKLKLYPNTLEFLQSLKNLGETAPFKKLDIEIHHFIVSAGLKELVEQLFPAGLITRTFGCRYQIIAYKGNELEPESVPVFCMDETMKTRSLFEISKGSFNDSKKQVNDRVEKRNLWAPFENIIYIGDGDTDIPSLSLTRNQGGLGVVVYNTDLNKEEVQRKYKQMRLDKRSDIITPANFSLDSELHDYLIVRCNQIRQRYEAEAYI